jgi:hypothetical protein
VMRKLEIDDCTIDKGTGKDETGHYSTWRVHYIWTVGSIYLFHLIWMNGSLKV